MDAIAPDLFSSHGFTQLIDIPTRISDGSISLIDLFFADNTEDIICHGTLPKIADHDGVLASYKLNLEKPKVKTQKVFDYRNADVDGLTKFIKDYDFDRNVFSQPIIQQAEIFNDVLINAFSKFVPCKTVTFRPNDQPWSNSYTRLLLRKKNRNYLLYKKLNNKYNDLLIQPNIGVEILTRYKSKMSNARFKARDAANASNLANRKN